MKNIDIFLTNLLLNIGIWGYILSCFLILIESIIPILPLSVFITLLVYKFGYLIGLSISYIFTILGCMLSYKIFNSKFSKKFNNFIDKKEKKKLKQITKVIKHIKLDKLCLIIAIPFTPAFLINIASGLSNMDFKKYLIGLIIGKLPLVIFWGVIGTSLINSIKNPINLIFILIMLIVVYIISRIVEKKEGLM